MDLDHEYACLSAVRFMDGWLLRLAVVERDPKIFGQRARCW